MSPKHTPIAYILTVLLICSQSLLAQTTIAGIVNNPDGELMIGVNVWSKQQKVGTATNLYGAFQITAEPGDTLLFTHIGYKDHEQVITDQSKLIITMVLDIELLEKVVVIGYGTQKKKDVTGATSSVEVEDFNGGIVTAPEQLIRGKVAGVELLQHDGEPGSAFTVRIRGTSTIRAGNDPLYVIDGYPVDITNPTPIEAGGTRFTQKNALEFLNPDDIASIDILKDASAAAIYGSRGANGVVLITTKKGIVGKPRLSYSSYVGTSQLREKVKVLSPQEYRTALNDFGFQINDFGSSTDWQDEIYQTGLTHNHNFSLNGGSDHTRYRASLSFHDQEGIIIGSQYTKYNGRLHLQQKAIDDKLKIEFNLSASRVSDMRVAPEIVIGSISQNPTWPIYDEEGNFFQPNPGFNHPVALQELSSNIIETSRLLSNLSAAFEIVDGLEYKINIGGDLSNATGKSFEYSQISNTNGSAAITNRELTSNLLEQYLTFNRQFSALDLTVLGGYSWQEFRNEGSLFSRGDFASDIIPLVDNIGAGQMPLANESFKEKNALQSFFGRVHMDLENKYLLTANFRADGSTRFGTNNKYGYFPSVALAWRLSNESFLQGWNDLDDLKLRVGWGLTGNQEIPNKITQPVFGTPQDAQAVLGPMGQPIIGYTFLRTANPDLQWEETQQFDVGIDASFGQGRWNFSADFFDKRTTDFLLFTLAASAPTIGIWTNLDGEIINQGWEVAFNGHILNTGSFKWETGITFTQVDNEVTGLIIPLDVGFVFGAGQSGVTPQTIRNGSPLGAFYGRRWLGFDENGNDVFKKDEEGADVFEEIGFALPDYTWGWTNNLYFKNLHLNFLFNGAHGHEVFNNTALARISKQNFAFGNNTTSEILNSDENINNNLTYSSRFLEDGSYIRLSQVTLGYQFPVGKISWLSAFQLYFTGSNLIMWTDYSGYDPEINIPLSGFNAVPTIGIDWDGIPRPTSFQFGLKVTFL